MGKPLWSITLKGTKGLRMSLFLPPVERNIAKPNCYGHAGSGVMRTEPCRWGEAFWGAWLRGSLRHAEAAADLPEPKPWPTTPALPITPGSP